MEEEDDEIIALQKEFEWLLKEEVNDILDQLHSIVNECARRFPIKINGVESLMKQEKVNLNFNSSSDSIKIHANLYGDNITTAEINLKIHKHSNSNQRFVIQSDLPWKLNQIQDASNHLNQALNLLNSPPLRYKKSPPTTSTSITGPVPASETTKSVNHGINYDFETSDEVIKFVDSVMAALSKGRSSLFVPKKKTIEELQTSRNMKVINPTVPNDVAISFYIQSHKLIAAIYVISKDGHGVHSASSASAMASKFDIYQCEASIQYLNEVLILFTISLQICQQLKDKLIIFTQYKEMQSKDATELLTPSEG